MNKKRFYSLMVLSILGALGAFYGHKAYQHHDQKKLKILFVGNSMSQDCVSYVPLILKNVAPELKFKIYDWYSGGYTAKNHLQDWQNGKTAQTLSIADNSCQWENYHGIDFLAEKVLNASKRSLSKISTFGKGGSGKILRQSNSNAPKNRMLFVEESNADKWKNYYISGVLTSQMADILKKEKFDLIVVQEYFNTMKGNYTPEDFDGFKGMVKYIQEHAPYSFRLAALLHPPRRGQVGCDGVTMDEIYHLSQKSTQKILQQTDVNCLIPAGIALYDACGTDLNKLGDRGDLSSDGIHAQEGLPCMIMAYVTTQWILNQLGIDKTILGDKTRITSENYPKIKVPGANFGSGVVEGSEDQYLLAQKLALEAIQKGNVLEKQSHKSSTQERQWMDVKRRVLE